MKPNHHDCFFRRVFYVWAAVSALTIAGVYGAGCVKRPPAKIVRNGYELVPSVLPPPDYHAPNPAVMVEIGRNTWPARCPVCGQEYTAEEFLSLPEDERFWFDDGAIFTVRHCNHEVIGEDAEGHATMHVCGQALVRIMAVRDPALK